MKNLGSKLIQVPVDILIGMAVFHGMENFFSVSCSTAMVAALLSTALFAELIGLKAK